LFNFSPHFSYIGRANQHIEHMSTKLEQGLWKEKAIERRLELKELNKRRKELNISREKWKAKYMAQKQLTDLLGKELGDIKKKLNEIINK
jgi:hypothetical protein